jgi:DNA-directed RNA polymerase specialized sigma24 family protein
VTDRPERPFADFVAREHADLRRLAVLLEGDRADAEELLRGVLVTLRARWRRLGRRADPLRDARRLMVRRVLARQSSDGPRTSGWVDDPYAGWDVDRHDDLSRALSALPVPTRAAVVLSVWAGIPDREVGDLLRSPEDTVRGEVVAGLAPLRAALAPVATPWHLGTRLPDDDELRAELTALADDDAGTVDPAQAAADAARTVTARRRRRFPVAVAATVAAVVLAAPALSGEEPAPVQAGTPGDRARPAPVPDMVDISTLPTRGSLAGDTAFLAGLVQQPWQNEFTGEYPMEVTTPADTRRVLFAGDVGTGRWALVIGHPELVDPVEEGIGGPYLTDEHFMAWFTGPPGAAPEDMELSTFPTPLMPGVTPALLDPPSGTLVVVGAPGDAVEVSERVEVDADGGDSRTWTRLRVIDGIAQTEIDPVDLPWTWAVNYRITRDGGMVTASTPDSIVSLPVEEELPDLGIVYPDGRPDEPGGRAAGWAAFIALSSLGAPTDDTEVTARVVEPVPGGEGTVALLTITLPSGAFLVSAQWAWDTGAAEYPGGADCGLDVRPADPPPDERLLVAACDMHDPVGGEMLGTALVAWTPPGVAAVRLYRGDGTFVSEHEVHDRTLVVLMEQGIRTVEAVTAGGVLLGRSEVLGHWSPMTD